MQYILFDLDGTLIDHFTTIHKSVTYAQRELGLPESNYAKVRAPVGGSVPITLSKLCGEDKVSLAEPLFRKHFEEIMFDDVFTLPGADWLLETLKKRGDKLGVFTNKYAILILWIVIPYFLENKRGLKISDPPNSDT